MRLMISVAALLATAAAQAGGDRYGRSTPASFDADQNGVVTREEAKAHPRLAGSFDAIDANKDGQLDKDELARHHEAHRADMKAKAVEKWQAADADGSGSLSRAEASAAPWAAERFDQLDADGNGELTREEMQSARMHAHEQMRTHAVDRFKTTDVNGDGAIDLAEAQTGMPRLAEKFSTVDADNDGRVTPAELKALRQR